jgi:uncharacterized protein
VRLDSMEEEVLPGGLRLATARTHRQRVVGLMRMDELPPGRALRIPRCSSVHTFWMRFPLDLVWLDRDGAVLRVDEDVARRRVRWCRGARTVVETRAGEGERYAAALRSASTGSGPAEPDSGAFGPPT